MGISYNEARQAQIKIEDQLFEDPNVVAVGVVAEVDTQGFKTGDYILEVGVVSIKDYWQAVVNNKSTIPLEYTVRGDDSRSRRIPIRVVEMNDIKALPSKRSPCDNKDNDEKNVTTSIITDRLLPAGTQSDHGFTDIPGYSSTCMLHKGAKQPNSFSFFAVNPQATCRKSQPRLRIFKPTSTRPFTAQKTCQPQRPYRLRLTQGRQSRTSGLRRSRPNRSGRNSSRTATARILRR